MDSTILAELITATQRAERERMEPHRAEALALAAQQQHSLRGALASTLMRIAICLDPAAGRDAAIAAR